MGRLAPNEALTREVLQRLLAADVRTFCLCPGGRNAPLVEALDALPPGIAEVLDFYEERSAAFFAVGRARRDGRPVAVVTTSGTAAAELLPAMVEAYYSCTPLVALTADRPRAYRGTGAPQTIEQAALFGVYARHRVDLDAAGTAWALDVSEGPAHINVCYDEPLLGAVGSESRPYQIRDSVGSESQPYQAADSAGSESRPYQMRDSVGSESQPYQHEVGPALRAGRQALQDALRDCTRPLVLLGGLWRTDDREAAVAFCRRLGAPVLAEASSHVKWRLGELLLRGGEAVARRGFAQGWFDSVIRLGDIPSFRLWRDLEETWRVPLVSVSRKPWPGVTHGLHVKLEWANSLASALPDCPPFPAARREPLLDFDKKIAALADCLLEEYSDSEPALVRRLSRAIPDGAFVYLGNSLPIREWNQFAALDHRNVAYGENRGANGIDGQLSTFFGGAFEERENWAIVGDLTALYDLAAPWALRHLRGRVRVAVINNGGGRIFHRLFANVRFQNRHDLALEPAAALWGMDYLDAPPVPDSSKAALLELRPSQEQTDVFWGRLRAGADA